MQYSYYLLLEIAAKAGITVLAKGLQLGLTDLAKWNVLSLPFKGETMFEHTATSEDAKVVYVEVVYPD